MNQIKKYIERLKQLQSLYEVGQPQHNAFGIAIDEANEMLVKNCIKPAVIPSVCVGCIEADYRNEWVEPCHSCHNGSNKQTEV